MHPIVDPDGYTVVHYSPVPGTPDIDTSVTRKTELDLTSATWVQVGDQL